MAIGETSDATPRMEEIETRSTVIEERGAMPEVTRGFDRNKVLVGIISAFVILFLLFSIFTRDGTQKAAIETKNGADTAGNVDPQGIVAAYGSDVPGTGDPTVPDLKGPADSTVDDGRRIEPSRQVPQKSERQVLAENERRSSLLAIGGSGQQGNSASRSINDGDREGNADASAPSTATALDDLRKSSKLGQARATRLPDRNYLITAGTFIPCTLLSAMNSTQPGYVTCLVPRDVYSDNGRVVLMEKGTKLLGEYQGGIRRGQYRLFVLWTRATTPTGVAVALGSPASDALGRAGVSGGVDTFFWQRFGAAFLFSLVEDGSQIARDQLGNRGNNVTSVPSDTSSTILRDTQQIQPVLKKNQGDNVGVIAAQDFDFSSVYSLQIKP